jgi:uncharacterized protein (TIGR02301 family)
MRLRARNQRLTLAGASLALLAATTASVSAQTTADTKPYDERLLRLAEILGSVHYLRELCESNDGQIWRDRMRELLDAEGSSALRRARLTRSFNLGYNSYSRTYKACTPSAQTTITRFMSEGVQIAETLVRTIP